MNANKGTNSILDYWIEEEVNRERSITENLSEYFSYLISMAASSDTKDDKSNSLTTIMTNYNNYYMEAIVNFGAQR